MSCAVSLAAFVDDDEHCTNKSPDANTPKTSIIAITLTGNFIKSPREVQPFRPARQELHVRLPDEERQQVFLQPRVADSPPTDVCRVTAGRLISKRGHRPHNKCDATLRLDEL